MIHCYDEGIVILFIIKNINNNNNNNKQGLAYDNLIKIDSSLQLKAFILC